MVRKGGGGKNFEGRLLGCKERGQKKGEKLRCQRRLEDHGGNQKLVELSGRRRSALEVRADSEQRRKEKVSKPGVDPQGKKGGE